MEIMNKNELLAQCRFFKGEDSCPESVLDLNRGYLFWESERRWVDSGGEAKASEIRLLCACGLSDEHMKIARKPADFFDIPFDLRAVMFTRLCHYSDVDPIIEARFFVDVVLPEYLG